MCGIAGLFSVERPITADLVAAVLRMLDAQAHRGPNDWGILIPQEAATTPEVRSLLEPRGWEHVRTYPGSAGAPAAILGARRLSILDLSSAGRMPMGTQDGRVWLTYNGEIYNFRELRSELEGRGHSFTSWSDTEVLLHAYQEWGRDALHRLRGMFALAILETRDTPMLFIAKDRFGIKPLYWGRKHGIFQFASEVRALMAGRLIPNDAEPRGFHGFLVYGSVPTPWTTVRDVFSLPAAHSVTIDEASYSRPEPRRYWSLPESGSARISREEAVSETRRLLAESVQLHLASDVPVGMFLSGGMDSSALTALAAKQVRTPLTSLCVTFTEDEFSEAEYAAAMARHCGTKHVEVRVTVQDFLADLERFLAGLDQPTVDGLNTYFVAKAAREAGLTVVLSGVGGDELFWGYPGFRQAPRLAKIATRPGVCLASRLLARLARAVGQPRPEKLDFLAEHPVLGPYLTVRGLYPPARAAELLDSGRLPLWCSEAGGSASSPAGYARLEVAHYLQDQLLRDTDVFGMLHSVEIRVPFLDHKLAEFVFSLPPEHLDFGRRAKPLLAEALIDHYPERLLDRPKMGFTFPFSRWMRESSAEISRRTESDQPVGDRAYENVLAQFRRGKVHWSRPWTLAVLRGMSRRRALPDWRPCPERRRILFLAPQLYGVKGGIPVYDQDLLRAMGESLPGIELTVVSLNDASMPDDAVSRGRVRFVGVGPRDRRLLKMRFAVAAISAALRGRPNVIISGHINLCPILWATRVLTRARTILLAYGVDVFEPGASLRWFARRAHRVVAISRFTASRVEALGIGKDRIEILAPAVDGEVFRPFPRPGGKQRQTLLTVGRMDSAEQYKGVDLILRALPIVRGVYPDIRYVIAGTGDDVLRLERLVDRLGLAAAVEFLGFVPDNDLPRLYGLVDLFLLLSTKEGFGIVFIEALACGAPVMGGRWGGSTDALLDGRLGRLVDPPSSESLAKAIIEELSAVRPVTTADRMVRRVATLEAYGFDRFRERAREIVGNA